MKIEKVNDYQIRCTLTKEDLASRRLKLSELAYGSQKAKELFRDMMEKANDEYGFEAENIPLMIEAIPINSECIVLIITKVEDPDELDTRFSKFAPGIHDSEDDDDDSDDADDNSESEDSSVVNIADLFKRFKEAVAAGKENKEQISFEGMAFLFTDIASLAKVCNTVRSFYIGSSSLYMNEEEGTYLLTITRNGMEVSDFVKTANLLSEYGAPQRGRSISESYLKEHFEIICAEKAIETLSELS